jgi:hypothetical protein
VSAVYNCCWFSPVQSFSGPSPAGLMTTFCCLRFETPSTWRARTPYFYLPVRVWPGYTSRHWVAFRRLLRLAGIRCRYLTWPSHGNLHYTITYCPAYNFSTRTAQKTLRNYLNFKTFRTVRSAGGCAMI